MRRTFIISLLVIMALSVQAQREITIEGTVTNVEEGTIMALFRNDGLVGKTIATDTIQNGKFYFKVEAEQEFEDLSIMGRSPKFPSMARQLYATPGCHIDIKGNDYKIFTWKVKSEVKEQQEYDSYMEAARPEYDKLQELFFEANEITLAAQQKQDMTEEERKKIQEQLEEISKQMTSIEIEGEGMEMKVMKNNPITRIWMNKLKGFSRMANYYADYPYREEVTALYNRLSEEQKQSEQGQAIAANLFPPTTVKVGDDMADADLYDLNGNLHHLSELKGKYILLDFWSSGCGPCIMSIPEMGEIKEKYKDRLAIVSLSTDTEKSWKAASEKHQMTWYNWSDKKQTSGLYMKYGVRGIPHYVLISPEGKVTSTWSGYGKGLLLKKMEELIK